MKTTNQTETTQQEKMTYKEIFETLRECHRAIMAQRPQTKEGRDALRKAEKQTENAKLNVLDTMYYEGADQHE